VRVFLLVVFYLIASIVHVLVGGDVARLKHHFVITNEDVIACTSVLDDIKYQFFKLSRDRKRIKLLKKWISKIVIKKEP